MQVAKPSTGVLVVERARYLLQLNKEQVAAFDGKIQEIAESAGWRLTTPNDLSIAASDATMEVHKMFAI